MDRSSLINDDEHNKFLKLIGITCKILSVTVARLYYEKSGRWELADTGLVTLTKDNERRNYFLQLYNMDNFRRTEEFEISFNSVYEKCRSRMHTVATSDCRALLSFADATESEKFFNEVTKVIKLRKEQKEKKRMSQMNNVTDGGMAYINAAPVNHIPAPVSSKKELKPNKKPEQQSSSSGPRKITKNDISNPTNFQHLDHMGLSDHFFTSENDETLKKYFKGTQFEHLLEDTNKNKDIYDFVEKHGGMSKLETEMKQREIKERKAPIPKNTLVPQKQLLPLPPPNRPPPSVFIGSALKSGSKISYISKPPSLNENKSDLFLDDNEIEQFVYYFVEKHGNFQKFLELAELNAQKHGHLKIISLIRNCKLSHKDEDVFTALHLRDIHIDIIKYMFENDIFVTIVDLEELNKVIAYSRFLYHKKCIAILDNFHLKSEKFTENICEDRAHLIDPNYEIDKSGLFGLTALHCAVIRGCTNLCAQLLKKGANCIHYVELPDEPVLISTDSVFSNALIKLTNQENALTLCFKMQGTLFPCFIVLITNEKINSYDGFGNSLVHLAAKCVQPKLIKLLCFSKDNVNITNKYGNTPLLELLSNGISQINDTEKIIDAVNILIDLGSDINKTSSSGISVFQYASKFYSEKLMLSLIKKNPKSINITKDDFKLVFVNNWFNYCKVLMEILSKEFLSDNITTEIINLAMVNKNSCLNKLFDNASTDVQHLILEDILLFSAVDENENVFNYFINIEIAKPKLFENGETLLTNLLLKNKIKFAKKLLQSKNDSVYSNFRNSKLQSPLQIAIEVDVLDIAETLIVETELLNEEDENGMTPLIQLLERITQCNDSDKENRLMLTIKSIISRGGDIFKVTSKGQVVIRTCTKPSIRSKVEKFYQTKKNKIVEIEKKICNVCLDREVDCVFECGHTVCMECSKELFVCPFCKSEPTNPKRIYLN